MFSSVFFMSCLDVRFIFLHVFSMSNVFSMSFLHASLFHMEHLHASTNSQTNPVLQTKELAQTIFAIITFAPACLMLLLGLRKSAIFVEGILSKVTFKGPPASTKWALDPVINPINRVISHQEICFLSGHLEG